MKKLIKNKNTQSGFTLVETLVTIFIFTIVMLGTTLMMQYIFANARQENATSNSTDQARRVANDFINAIRNGAYGANGAYPINQATDTQVIFFSTAPSADGTVSRIRYYILNNTLYEGITKPSGTPATYNLANETITTLISSMSLGGNPLFYYYDGNYDGSGNALTNPVNLNQVKYIKINLTILKQLTATSTSTFTVSAGASMRNLKTNLGN